jgi:hypothetical protein
MAEKTAEIIACTDCGGEYKAGQPHYMFCPAKTCSECGTTYRHVIEVVEDHEPDEDGLPYRLCDDCINQ